jgi:hypothetical protein
MEGYGEKQVVDSLVFIFIAALTQTQSRDDKRVQRTARANLPRLLGNQQNLNFSVDHVHRHVRAPI